jgi:hypothetical protein
MIIFSFTMNIKARNIVVCWLGLHTFLVPSTYLLPYGLSALLLSQHCRADWFYYLGLHLMSQLCYFWDWYSQKSHFAWAENVPAIKEKEKSNMLTS